tara:strand:- start:997 stop:1248 length:252 start_codon:yes stop_codon:yes gene_type:complete
MSDIFFKCPSCGYSVDDDLEPTTADDFNWMYTKTTNENKWDALKKSEMRMKEELDYGIPEEQDLGSCITGVWENENKKCKSKR